MKIKTSELTGAALDWLVDEALLACNTNKPKYSTDWCFGGPVVESYRMELRYDSEWAFDPNDPEDNGDRWFAGIRNGDIDFIAAYGPTPLVAAMRCFCINKLGDEVEVPDELT